MNFFKGWDKVVSEIPEFLTAFLCVTVWVAIVGTLLALTIGIVVGLMSSSKNKFIRFIVRVYVEFFQNTPILIQIFFIYLALPAFGVRLHEMTIAIMIVSLYHGAYISEIVRSGVESVPKGQYEAAESQGFSHIQSMVYIVLPQTIRLILPPLTSQIVALFKNTSVLQVIAGGDLMYVAASWAGYTGITAPPYLIAAVLYFSICYPLTCLSRYFEKKNEAGYVQKKSKDPAILQLEGGALDV